MSQFAFPLTQLCLKLVIRIRMRIRILTWKRRWCQSVVIFWGGGENLSTTKQLMYTTPPKITMSPQKWLFYTFLRNKFIFQPSIFKDILVLRGVAGWFCFPLPCLFARSKPPSWENLGKESHAIEQLLSEGCVFEGRCRVVLLFQAIISECVDIVLMRNKYHLPGDSKWPFHPLVGGHSTP